MYVTPCSFCTHFLSTFDDGSHEVSGGEEYMKDIFGPEECKNVG
jgi:hypothetical protein